MKILFLLHLQLLFHLHNNFIINMKYIVEKLNGEIIELLLQNIYLIHGIIHMMLISY